MHPLLIALCGPLLLHLLSLIALRQVVRMLAFRLIVYCYQHGSTGCSYYATAACWDSSASYHKHLRAETHYYFDKLSITGHCAKDHNKTASRGESDCLCC